jgi:cysteine desulfurase
MGLLYVRRGVPFLAQQNGGGQERQRRAGTENVAGIVGMTEALRITQESLAGDRVRISGLSKRLRDGAEEGVARVGLNGHPERRLANNVSYSFEGADAQALLAELDATGIACSAGAACGATTVEPSHVLLAMGLTLEQAACTLRFSLGHDTTADDIDRMLEVLPAIVERARAQQMVPAP